MGMDGFGRRLVALAALTLVGCGLVPLESEPKPAASETAAMPKAYMLMVQCTFDGKESMAAIHFSPKRRASRTGTT